MHPDSTLPLQSSVTHLAAAVPGPTAASATLTQPDVVCGECVFGHTHCHCRPRKSHATLTKSAKLVGVSA